MQAANRFDRIVTSDFQHMRHGGSALYAGLYSATGPCAWERRLHEIAVLQPARLRQNRKQEEREGLSPDDKKNRQKLRSK